MSEIGLGLSVVGLVYVGKELSLAHLPGADGVSRIEILKRANHQRLDPA